MFKNISCYPTYTSIKELKILESALLRLSSVVVRVTEALYTLFRLTRVLLCCNLTRTLTAVLICTKANRSAISGDGRAILVLLIDQPVFVPDSFRDLSNSCIK